MLTEISRTGCTGYVVPGLGIPEAVMSFGMAMSFVIGTDQPGIYEVTLTFLEPNVAAAGVRVFSVFANDAPVLSRLDLFAHAGLQKVVKRAFTVDVIDRIQIDLRSDSGRPAVLSTLTIQLVMPWTQQ